jgi:membrane associated rhomboid family serine protease
MRGRYPAAPGFSYSFGPGPLTPAIKMLIAANVVMFVITIIGPGTTVRDLLGLQPRDTLVGLRIWQPLTYLFLHGGFFHILFNMLTLWMFGTELERMWGSRFFTKYYFVCGLGAAATQVLLSFVPGTFGDQMYLTTTIGASGAVYGVLLAYALYFPTRPIYMYFVFPIPAKYFVMILGGISLFSAMGGGGGVAHTAHLGGLVAGYLYLKGTRINLISELQYRWVKWRINRMRRKFDVYSGGRSSEDVNRRVH